MAKRMRETAAGSAAAGGLLDAAPATILALQQSSGNRRVTQMLASPATVSVAMVQRLPAAIKFVEDMDKAGKSQTGKNVLFDLGNALRAYHRENERKPKDTPALLAAIETVIARCGEWLKIPKSPVGPDAARTKVVDTLLKEAEAEQGVLDPKKAKAATVAAVPALPADRGTYLQDRLDWMDKKRQQPTSSPAQKGAEELILTAGQELKRILKKQTHQIAADDLRSKDKSDDRDEKAKEAIRDQQDQADRIKLRTGADALSAILGRLFAIFEFTPLAFKDTTTTTAVQQQTAFVKRAKARLAGLVVKGPKRDFTGFDDVELIVGGSSALGYSPHKKTDFHDKSDLDLAVVSPKLLDACRDAGGDIRGTGDRTGPDPLPEVAALSRELEGLVGGRDVSIMVYASRDAAQRQVGVQIS